MSCSKSSDEREYESFLAWASATFPKELFEALPAWKTVSGWRGKIVAVCEYEASYQAPEPLVWDEGYRVWWRLSNVVLLETPIPCRGNVGMWRLSL